MRAIPAIPVTRASRATRATHATPARRVTRGGRPTTRAPCSTARTCPAPTEVSLSRARALSPRVRRRGQSWGTRLNNRVLQCFPIEYALQQIKLNSVWWELLLFIGKDNILWSSGRKTLSNEILCIAVPFDRRYYVNFTVRHYTTWLIWPLTLWTVWQFGRRVPEELFYLQCCKVSALSLYYHKTRRLLIAKVKMNRNPEKSV